MPVKTNLKKYIDDRGISQAWIVRQTGLSRSTVAKATSDGKIELETAFIIARILKCNINELFYYVENE